MHNEQQYFDTNRALWNEKTTHHTASAFYDMEGWLAGATSLKQPELELLGDVQGKSILHLQCHVTGIKPFDGAHGRKGYRH